VSFMLPGFGTFKRDGIELSTGFTATVNAELKVGSLQETVTVSGQTPVVDVQNVVQNQVIRNTVLESLPNAKSIQSLAALVPGMTSGGNNQDVGGTSGDSPVGTAIHGGRPGDQHMFFDGMRTNNLHGSGGGANQSIWFNPASVEEISLEVGNLAIQSETGGMVFNVIPKTGGNTFKGMLLANGTKSGLQSDNLTDDLKASGLTATTRVKNIFDLDAALGGPILRDKLWFHTAHRRWGNENYAAGVYFNATPLAWTYTPDLTRQALDQNLKFSSDIRLTWQVNQKNKITGIVLRQDQCLCYTGINGSWSPSNRSPEASTYVINFPSAYGQVKWTDTISNKFLLEAGASFNEMNWQSRRQPWVAADVISVTELSTNFTYRASPSYSWDSQSEASLTRSYFGTVAASYVTGSHAVKVGTMISHSHPYSYTRTNGDMTYQFLNGLPRAVVLRATPLITRTTLKHAIGTYAQDQWTMKQLTLNLGLRYENFNSYVPAQDMPAGRFVPARSYAKVPDVAVWRDLTPRLGVSYDLFGNGNTAVKFSVSRYLNSEAAGSALAKNPLSRVVDTATRAWTDGNGDYVPNCDLLNPDGNGECGPISDRNFGSTSAISTTYDENYLHGFGKRGYNWETSAGIQHQLRPGVSVNAMYFHRTYGNFLLTDNLAVNPSDFDPYCITVPVDSRLPTSGSRLCGFYDINPSKFGKVENFNTFAKDYGKLTDVYDGVDVTVSARLPRGAFVQGGMNVGHEVTDMCDVMGKADLPAAAIPVFFTGYSSLIPSLSGLASPSTNFCRIAPAFWRPDVKLSTTYPLPWWDVQLSGTLQSVPGPWVVATYVAPNSEIAPSLGRNLAAGPNSTATVTLFQPGTMFGDRMNQFDFRVTKMVRMSRTRIRAMVDIYNLFNASPVLSLNTRYGSAWQRPLVVLQGRFAKFGVQVDF
jgi:hypothetical protein